MTRFRLVRAMPWLGFIFRPRIISAAYESLIFLLIYRRIPNFRRTGYVNDLLFNIKIRETDNVLRSFTSDKEFTKIFVNGVLGKDMNVETIAILRGEQDIEEFDFPDRCVIKPTHMSGEVIFHKSGPVSEANKDTMRKWLKWNFGDLTGERNYQRLEPKIIVEPWLKLNGDYCNDYRFYIFNGKLTVAEIKQRQSESLFRQTYVTAEWCPFPGTTSYAEGTWQPDQDELETLKPECLSRMIEVAESIGQHFEFVRVDFFSDGTLFFVGEISHINAGLRETFNPVEAERIFTSTLS